MTITPPLPARDHGGNLDQAIATFGGTRSDWVDLSTGINPMPYPVPLVSPEAWSALPRAPEMTALCDAARQAYATRMQAVPFAGAQGAIQAIPFLVPPGDARVLTPTYNEHAAALRMGGWRVTEVSSLDALAGAKLAVVVTPNNPTGDRYPADALLDVSRTVGHLIVDESFVDPEPDLSLAPLLSGTSGNIIVLRSFGKFYGLAGIRLGFALTSEDLATRLKALAGPWPVSGPTLEIARKALLDRPWSAHTVDRLRKDTRRLDAAALSVGWQLVGGTALFRTYKTPDAKRAQNALARCHVWSRIFPYSAHWLRLGLPAQTHWDQVERAITAAGS